MEKKFKIKKEVFPLPEDFNTSFDTKERAIFIPGIGNNCNHFLYLIDVDNKNIILWEIDSLEIKNQLREDIDQSLVSVIPWNQENLDKFLEIIFFPHSADYYDRKVYVSFIEANFILEFGYR